MGWLLDIWRLMRGADLRTGCKHDWDEYSFGRRQCRKCEDYQQLCENLYPEIGQAKYEWH